MSENKNYINYCLKCKKKCDITDVEIKTSKNNRKMLLGKCNICDTRTCRFLKKEKSEMSKKLDELVKVEDNKINYLIGNLSEQKY